MVVKSSKWKKTTLAQLDRFELGPFVVTFNGHIKPYAAESRKVGSIKCQSKLKVIIILSLKNKHYQTNL